MFLLLPCTWLSPPLSSLLFSTIWLEVRLLFSVVDNNLGWIYYNNFNLLFVYLACVIKKKCLKALVRDSAAVGRPVWSCCVYYRKPYMIQSVWKRCESVSGDIWLYEIFFFKNAISTRWHVKVMYGRGNRGQSPPLTPFPKSKILQQGCLFIFTSITVDIKIVCFIVNPPQLTITRLHSIFYRRVEGLGV